MKRFISLLLALFALILGIEFTYTDFHHRENNQLETLETVQVSKIIDGDTFQIASGERVRYIGIDTPEIFSSGLPKCHAKKAYEINKQLILGKSVTLERDISEKDQYGRLLRYVYVEKDSEDIFINQYLVENGYAKAKTYRPDLKHDLILKSSEAKAKQKSIGVWSNICD